MKKNIILLSSLLLFTSTVISAPNKLHLKVDSCSFVEKENSQNLKLSPSIPLIKDITCNLNTSFGSSSFYACQQSYILKINQDDNFGKEYELVLEKKGMMQLVNKFPNVVITINKISGEVMIVKSTLPKLTQSAEICTGHLYNLNK